MKTQNSFSKAISSVALMAAISIAILIQAASTANAQTASTDSMVQGKAAELTLVPVSLVFGINSLKGSYGWNSHVIEFFVVGTAIVPIRADHHIPTPQLVLSVND